MAASVDEAQQTSAWGRRYPERVTPTTPHRGAPLQPERLLAYTDGVFAIAATLLVLDLSVDSIGRVTSDRQLWGALGGLVPNITGFVISFALLSLLWVIHVRQFRDIVRVDAGLLWLNNARLLFIVLIPFTTSLAAEYSDWTAGRVLLPLNFFLAALLSWLSWVWASARDGHLLREGVHDAAARGMDGLVAALIGAVVAGASVWLGSWAFLLFLASEPVTRIVSRSLRRTGAGATIDG